MRLMFVSKDFPDFKEITDQLVEYFNEIFTVGAAVLRTKDSLQAPFPFENVYRAISFSSLHGPASVSLIEGTPLEELVSLRSMATRLSNPDVLLGHAICLVEKIVHEDIDLRSFVVYRSGGDELRKAFRSSGLTRPFDRAAIMVSADPDEAADQIRQEIEGVLGIEEDSNVHDYEA